MNQPIVLRTKDVLNMLGISRTTLYAWMQGSDFPPSLKLGARVVGWRYTEIEAWIASRPSTRKAR